MKKVLLVSLLFISCGNENNDGTDQIKFEDSRTLSVSNPSNSSSGSEKNKEFKPPEWTVFDNNGKFRPVDQTAANTTFGFEDVIFNAENLVQSLEKKDKTILELLFERKINFNVRLNQVMESPPIKDYLNKFPEAEWVLLPGQTIAHQVLKIFDLDYCLELVKTGKIKLSNLSFQNAWYREGGSYSFLAKRILYEGNLTDFFKYIDIKNISADIFIGLYKDNKIDILKKIFEKGLKPELIYYSDTLGNVVVENSDKDFFEYLLNIGLDVNREFGLPGGNPRTLNLMNTVIKHGDIWFFNKMFENGFNFEIYKKSYDFQYEVKKFLTMEMKDYLTNLGIDF